MKEFKDAYIGLKCNVPYIHTLTIVRYVPERNLVQVHARIGTYDNTDYFIPLEDIIIHDKYK